MNTYDDDCKNYAAGVLNALAERENSGLYTYLFAQYETDIRAGWDFDAIKSDCADNVGDDGIGQCYLGTVFEIMPSGKFYMPWANSNVDEYEAFQDSVYTDAMEYVFGEHGLTVESGEGDPCDLFACMEIELESTADSRLCEEFGDEYTLIQTDYDLRAIVEYAGIPQEFRNDITGAFVKVGDGDYDEVWFTESSRYYDLAAEYRPAAFWTEE